MLIQIPVILSFLLMIVKTHTKEYYVIAPKTAICKILDNEIVHNFTCSSKNVNRSLNFGSKQLIFKPGVVLTHVGVKIQLYRRFGTIFRPFMIKLDEDMCAIFNGSAPLLHKMLRVAESRKYGNYFDPCPLYGRRYYRNMPFNYDNFPDIIPAGEYHMDALCYTTVNNKKINYMIVQNFGERYGPLLVCKGIGGGIKHKYHWVQFTRDGPTEGPPQLEKIIDVIFDGCRTAKVALVAVGDQLKYIIASENMKPGDIIKTSRFIPRIAVRANEGDAYPLGALPVNTQIHCLEKNPGHPFHYITAAGTYGTIIRKFGEHVVVQIPSKREFAFHQTCMATVGRVSNVDHGKTPVGSPNRKRELGYRPRSGLWQRKTGRHGRKIRRLPPMRIVKGPPEPKPEVIKLTESTLTLSGNNY